VEVLNQGLGIGFDESGPYTLNQLLVEINALPNFTATVTGNDVLPAAFLKISRDVPITATGTNIEYLEWTQANATVASPFAGATSNKDREDFENASMVNINNVLYIATGYDSLFKYDGQTLFKAGLPKANTPGTVISGGTGITNSSAEYIVVYQQIDAKNSFINGIESQPSTGLNVTNQSIDVTIENIQAGSGFNTNCAITAGAQIGVTTIAVDDGSAGAHTLQVGDKAYFFDGVAGAYTTRNVTARTASTIDIDGAAVNVADNAVISNNLKIELYRNQNAGSTFRLVEELPNNSFTATQLYVDTIPDSGLGIEFVEPIKPRGLAPIGKYLTVFRNLLLIGGQQDVNSVSYSDIDSPEYFPPGQNGFTVDTKDGDKVTGIAALTNAVYVFKDNSIHQVSGDIAGDNFRVDLAVQDNIGCEAHQTIREVEGSLFFLSKKGVYSLKQGTPAQEISSIIEPIFTSVNRTFNFKKAVAINWNDFDKYIIYMPTEQINASNERYNDPDESRTLVYDYYRQAWVEWSNIDALGGLALIGLDDLYFAGRFLETASGDVVSYINRINNTGDTFDYADHDKAIAFTYKTHWEALGDPSVFKKFLRLKLHALDASVNDFESDTFIIDVDTEDNYLDVTSSSDSFDFSGGTTGGWGVDPWGEFTWGNSRLLAIKRKMRANKVRSKRLIFKNDTIHQNILMSGYEMETATPYKARIKE
jgi:hypothetical protein